ncbi:G1/S-specific cyclin-E1 isoform X2 [Gymnodraco acuticeps]|uniref:G2/mitotic-specific cyclin-B2 n=1 Tax=Gymnodraco acuticeps TaxID=8218 RepID=A0A6P8TBK7_GYMAC|nr:G1/S-specific cyclin-E1 isoform X2 [Gymnodraco acuticeps]
MRRQREDTEAKSVAPGAFKENTVRPRKRKADVAIYLQDPDEEVAEMMKKKQRECEPGWSPDAGYTSPQRCIPTPDQEEDPPVALINAGFPHYNFHNVYVTPVRCAPLPALCWASKDVVWNNMLEKDKTYAKDVHVMEKHPHLQPKMRAVLLDWLMEVSEVYKLHRESYHLAQDYFDRFMATQRNVFKTTLQLIGITCLFIAAKVEEMYPPKVHQFAYVTDEACTEDEILRMEIIIMKLLDLCILDVHCLEFSNGILAASALFHFSSLELVENVSALKRVEVEECVRWMVPFAIALQEVGGSSMRTFTGISADDMHNIQTHASYITWLDKAYSYQDVELQRHGNCPVPSGVLTPPQSSEKTEELVPVDAAVLKIKPGFKLHPHNDAVQSSDAITETDQTTANPK